MTNEQQSIDLDNRAWLTWEGGYKTLYNAARPLRKLKVSSTQEEMKTIFDELWENLHHQGDVGLASYMTVPHLVSICMEKRSLDWNFIGLCVLIENCRLEKHNPPLPPEYQDQYFDSLIQLEKYLLVNFKSITDQDALRLALALFATVNGQPALGKAIEKLDEDQLGSFLEQF